MSDTANTDTTTDTGTETETAPDLAAEVEKWKNLARKQEDRAKANAKAAQELEEFRRQSMTDTERAIEQARQEARREALTEAGGKTAAAEFRAAAAGRLEPEQVETLIAGINLARFITDDGDVDREAVMQFVDGIAPKQQIEQTATVLDLGQGTRSAGKNTALNDDALLRDIKAKVGVR